MARFDLEICDTIERAREAIARLKKAGRAAVGLVPTMGALHEGHLSLIRAARGESDVVVVSIFVNPTQFAPDEDLAGYPRTFDADCKACGREGVDVVFTTTPEEMYPQGYDTYVVGENLTSVLCGRARPAHFRGVLTVVLKLFNIIGPDFAYFGRKDAQQAIVVRRMVRDLNLPVRIVTMPVCRESDGLAMSSRNSYLSPEERRDAVCLYEALCRARELVSAGERNAGVLRDEMRKIITARPSAEIDYVEVVDVKTLERVERVSRDVLVALAVYVGKTRLIDNICLTPEGKEIPC